MMSYFPQPGDSQYDAQCTVTADLSLARQEQLHYLLDWFKTTQQPLDLRSVGAALGEVGAPQGDVLLWIADLLHPYTSLEPYAADAMVESGGAEPDDFYDLDPNEQALFLLQDMLHYERRRACPGAPKMLVRLWSWLRGVLS